jgi:hypothetical protein
MSAPLRPLHAPSRIAAAFGTGQAVVLLKRPRDGVEVEDPERDAVEAWAEERNEAAEREMMEAATGGVLAMRPQGA